MAQVNKTVSLTATTGVLIDLREEGASGNGPYNKVGYLELELWSKVDSITAVLQVIPVVVEDGDAPPAVVQAQTFAGHGDTFDLIVLQADTDETTFVRTRDKVKLGVPFAKGYQDEVHGKPLATHLNVCLVNASNECFLTIVGG
jgi:hypothetical protein